MSSAQTSETPDPEIQTIRDAVRALCADFPGEYWRELDRERAYPREFVQTLADNGFLAVLIPEEYGGTGLGIDAAAAILDEIHKSGGNGAACHAQMYTMGTLLGHGSVKQKAKWLPQDRLRRYPPPGLRRDRADQRRRHLEPARHGGSQGR